MWKWLLGLVIVGFLVCAGAVGGGGWYLWSRAEAQKEAARAERETAALRAEEQAQVMRSLAEHADHLQAARAALAAGDHAAAEAAFSAVLETDPTSIEALVGRGRSYAHLERLALAETDLRAVTKLDGSRRDAWESLAWVLARDGRDAEAVDALDHLLALDGADAKAWRDRANARYRSGDPSGARSDAQRACELGLTEGCALVEKIAAATRR